MMAWRRPPFAHALFMGVLLCRSGTKIKSENTILAAKSVEPVRLASRITLHFRLCAGGKNPRKTPDSVREPGNLRPVRISIDHCSTEHRCGQRAIAKIEIPVKPARPRCRQVQILSQLCRQLGKRPLCRRTAAQLAVDRRRRRLPARDGAVYSFTRQRIREPARIPCQKNPLFSLRRAIGSKPKELAGHMLHASVAEAFMNIRRKPRAIHLLRP